MVPISTSDSLRTTPWPITSMPRRPARPISCVISPVVRFEKLTPSNFVKDETTPPRGHVDTEGQCLGREYDLDQAALEELFDHLLVVGQQSRVVLGHAPAQQP